MIDHVEPGPVRLSPTTSAELDARCASTHSKPQSLRMSATSCIWTENRVFSVIRPFKARVLRHCSRMASISSTTTTSVATGNPTSGCPTTPKSRQAPRAFQLVERRSKPPEVSFERNLTRRMIAVLCVCSGVADHDSACCGSGANPPTGASPESHSSSWPRIAPAGNRALWRGSRRNTPGSPRWTSGRKRQR